MASLQNHHPLTALKYYDFQDALKEGDIFRGSNKFQMEASLAISYTCAFLEAADMVIDALPSSYDWGLPVI